METKLELRQQYSLDLYMHLFDIFCVFFNTLDNPLLVGLNKAINCHF